MRKKVVVLWEPFLHAAKVPSEQILTAEDVHAWKMVDALIGFHSVETVALDGSITPKYVPVFFVRSCHLNFELFGHCPEHRIMAVVYIYVQSALLKLFLLFLLLTLLLFLFLGIVVVFDFLCRRIIRIIFWII